MTAFPNDPPWERAVKSQLWQNKSRQHTIEEQIFFLGKQNITTGLFVSFTPRGKKKSTNASFSRGPSQLFAKIAEVTKAQRRELTWRAGPTPTALTTIHANILCFCWLGIVPFLYASAGMSTSYTTAVCDTFTNRATLPTDILYDFVWLAADRHFQNTLEIKQIAINQKKTLFF